jgi:hypothetical protein
MVSLSYSLIQFDLVRVGFASEEAVRSPRRAVWRRIADLDDSSAVTSFR